MRTKDRQKEGTETGRTRTKKKAGVDRRRKRNGRVYVMCCNASRERRRTKPSRKGNADGGLGVRIARPFLSV